MRDSVEDESGNGERNQENEEHGMNIHERGRCQEREKKRKISPPLNVW